jgi:hypothetical protein
MRLRPALLLTLAFLGACATPPPASEAPVAEVATPSASVPKAPQVPPVAAKARAKKPGPIPIRALNVKTECRFRDETGYNGELKISVEEARVSAFEARVNIPQRGSCIFNLKNFRQTRELPNVELTHQGNRCVVHLWEQGERVTVAFQQCQAMCSGQAWEYLWPILAYRGDDSCA